MSIPQNVGKLGLGRKNGKGIPRKIKAIR